jgi:hypothetical protein
VFSYQPSTITPVQYRSSRINPAPGVHVLPPKKLESGRRRALNAGLDIVALPFVAVGPRRAITVSGCLVPLRYGFRRWAWRTERCVEIALGARALQTHRPREILEVGNVLPLAGFTGQTVVDKYEQSPGFSTLTSSILARGAPTSWWSRFQRSSMSDGTRYLKIQTRPAPHLTVSPNSATSCWSRSPLECI